MGIPCRPLASDRYRSQIEEEDLRRELNSVVTRVKQSPARASSVAPPAPPGSGQTHGRAQHRGAASPHAGGLHAGRALVASTQMHPSPLRAPPAPGPSAPSPSGLAVKPSSSHGTQAERPCSSPRALSDPGTQRDEERSLRLPKPSPDRRRINPSWQETDHGNVGGGGSPSGPTFRMRRRPGGGDSKEEWINKGRCLVYGSSYMCPPPGAQQISLIQMPPPPNGARHTATFTKTRTRKNSCSSSSVRPRPA